MDELSEFLDELRLRWRDSYFWADHVMLQTVLLCLAAGAISLAFKYAELRLEAAMTPTVEVP
jgi:hypothetical protein